MTYCVAMRVDEGLVFLSDTRTNAGVDHVSAARKMAVFEQPGERVLVLLAAGNLALTQAVMQLLAEPAESQQPTLYNVPSVSDAARLVGNAVREVHRRDAATLAEFSVDFNCSFILGGQIKGHGTRLFMIYAAGNFVEASQVSPYFQIGESKYGKPIIDRVVTPATPLDEVAHRFNQYNRVQIRIRDAELGRRPVSGVFQASDPQTFIDFIRAGARVSVTRPSGEEIVVSSSGTTENTANP